MGLALMVVLAISVVSSASASAATNNPQWQVAGKVLTAGESKEVTAEANGAQKLNIGGAFLGNIKCTALKLQARAKILGSTAPNPGTDEETIVYEKCELEGKPECKINGEAAGVAKITTNLLKSTLVFETKAAAEAQSAPTLTLFEPKVGTVFVTLELTGTCNATGKFEITGQVAAKNPEGATEKEVHVSESPATAITKYFVNEGGVTTEKKVTALKFGIFPASYIGNSNIRLSTKELWSIFN
jgi:hypothetical protein